MRNLLIAFGFITYSAQAQTVIFSEDFQNGVPGTFTIVTNDTNTPHADVSEYTEAWICVADTEDPTDSVAASTSYFDPAGIADRWLITPSLALGSFGNIISWNARSQDASYPDTYYLMISTTDTQISSFNDTIAIVVSESFEWNSHELDLNEFGYADQTVHIAFVNKTNDGFKLYIDDIEMRVDDPVQIDNLENSQVAIYPNPSSDFVTIKVDNLIQTKLFNVNGAQVLVSRSDQIDIRELVSGSYIAEILTENGIFRKRIVRN